jgi:hypothetical protein
MTPEEEQFLIKHLTKIFEIARHDALVEVVSRVAEAAGIREIEGFSIKDFYWKRHGEISEELVKDYADTNIAMASKVKDLWKQLEKGQL